MTEKSNARRFSFSLCAALLVSFALLLVTALEWPLIDELTPFLFVPLACAEGLLYFGICCWSILHLLWYRAQWRVACLPLVTCALTLLIVVLVPFTRLWIDYDFRWKKAEREMIVSEVLAGTIRPNVDYNPTLISLDADAPRVSAGGNQIVVEEHDGHQYVFFFTYRGVLDNYSGFLYVPLGGTPVRYSDLGEAESTELTQFDKNWFFASHR